MAALTHHLVGVKVKRYIPYIPVYISYLCALMKFFCAGPEKKSLRKVTHCDLLWTVGVSSM